MAMKQFQKLPQNRTTTMMRHIASMQTWEHLNPENVPSCESSLGHTQAVPGISVDLQEIMWLTASNGNIVVDHRVRFPPNFYVAEKAKLFTVNGDCDAALFANVAASPWGKLDGVSTCEFLFP